MRKLLLPISMALVLAACGGGADDSPTVTPTSVADASSGETATTPAPATVESEGGESTASPTVDPAAPSFDGPPAPGFELVLSDGSTFSLAAEQKPVYIVFWAEW